MCLNTLNTLNDLPNKVCVPNEIEDLNLSVLNTITGTSESNTLTKHISCKCKCKFDERKCSSYQWWNSDKCRCEYKKRHECKKDNVWNPATCSCENRKYLLNIMDDSAITCGEIIESYNEETKTILTNFNEI